MSSGPQLHRLSFSTDLREKDVVFGGEKKLYNALTELIESYKPKAVFIYSTCIVGVIGDDVEAVARQLTKETGVDVLPVMSEGFKGTKKDGYKAACDAFRITSYNVCYTKLLRSHLETEKLIEFYKPDIFCAGIKEKYVVQKSGVPLKQLHSYDYGGPSYNFV